MDKKFIFLFLCIFAGTAQAQWSNDPAVNTVLDKPGDQRAPLLTTDGNGGAIVAWDEDNGVFANWVDKFGFRRWGNSGVRISPVGSIAHLTNITSDGQGGAVIVWSDLTHAREVGFEVVRIIENEIFAQRVDSLGQLVWDAGGVGVRTKIDSTTVAGLNVVTSDYNEFIVFWFEDRKHPYPQTGPWDFYAQKIDSDGDLQWQANGNLISAQGSMHNVRYRIVTDGAGGFLLNHFDNDPMAQQATLVERISSDGEFLWQPVSVAVNTGGAFEMDTDGQGGAVVAGIFFPGGGGSKIGQTRAQRISSDGELLWGDSGTVAMDKVDKASSPRIVSDGNSGAYIYWDAKDSSGERKGFFQHINTSGMPLQVPISVRFNDTSTIHPIYISDQKNGMILLAIDFFGTTRGEFWAVRVDFDGNLVWDEQGVLFRLRPFNDWPFFFDVVADGSGGFISAWAEFNNNTSTDIVLQQVNSKGALGEVITAVEQIPDPIGPREYTLFQNYPNPFNPETEIRFALRKSGIVSLIIYDLSGKEVISLIDRKLSVGEHRVTWDGKDDSRKPAASGIYFYLLKTNHFQAVRKMLLVR